MMGLFDSALFAWLQPRPRTTPPRNGRYTAKAAARSIVAARAMAGGRLSQDKTNQSMATRTITAPADAESEWRVLDLDTQSLGQMSPARLMELMSDLSPEISVGLWNFLRLCNPGWEARAYQPGSEEEDTAAQRALDDFLTRCTGPYDETTAVPFDTIINLLYLGAFLRGAFFGELVLDENGRVPLNLATPDPYSARFARVNHPALGGVWQLGQYQQSQWVPLDRETIRYVPIDPLPGRPYGRALASPALFTALFLIGLLHDLKRVVMQQGYPRIDISVNFEMLADMAPPEAQPGTEEFENWVADVMAEIDSVYSTLQPDDAYVHSDTISVNRPVGTVSAESLGSIDALITKLERMAARAMKQMPLLLGIDESTTDANANRQWEIQTAGIKSIQHLCETMLEGLLQLALEAQGVQAAVEFRFAELRAAEMLRDAQTEQMRIANAMNKYLYGWISHDEAAKEITGRPADADEPRHIPNNVAAPDIIGDDGDGAERVIPWQNVLAEIRAARTAVGDRLEGVFGHNGHE